jgi:TatD DNase family protein
MPVFYDTHAHLDYQDFDADRPLVIERAHQVGVQKIITIGTDLPGSRQAIKLSEEYPQVYAVAGWHPNDATKAEGDIRPALQEMASHPKVVALGETGLDYYRLPPPGADGNTAERDSARQRQRELFTQHLEVAAAHGLGCVIHERDAFEDVLQMIQPFARRVPCVFHCFVNTPANWRRLLDLGCVVSFTGILTFKNAQSVRETVAATPLGQFMLETDCPFLAPTPHRGKRCEPAYVRHTAETVCELKKCSLDELSEATCAAARRFFPKIS